jgi:outer membrane biosynthesis protein TonB
LPTNEEGEFELILGNRQLLSVFFIVVILLGVFFTMGYIVGRNSSPVATADATTARKSDKPLVVESPAPSAPEPAPEEPRAPRESTPPAPISTAQQQPPEIPKPKSEPVKAPPKSEPVKAAKAEKAEKEKAEKKPAPSPAPAATSSAAPSGTYLQLAATTKREADIMVDVLRQKKFGALAAEIPEKPGLFRVLVGPMQEAQVNKTKTDLQSAGFPGDKSIKRSF